MSGVDLRFEMAKGVPVGLGGLGRLGSALALQARGHWFEAGGAHHLTLTESNECRIHGTFGTDI